MIKIVDLTFGFKKPILKNISLNIEDENQIIGLLGPNGAGKTTLLNILGNYYQKFSGKIEGNNKVFFIPDKEYIPLDFSINDCLSIFPKVYPFFNTDRAVKMINFLDIDRTIKLSDFSKGMKEQVHIVFGLSQDVDTYLFDEPLASIDPFHRETLIKLIKNYRRPNSNVLLSTHLISDVEDVFEEVIFIDSGKILLHEKYLELMKTSFNGLEKKYLEVMKDVVRI
ncbi:TPA: ATP-binding cassette domain-containing protein [Enterococcus faecium]|uniref:ATP-binding cassette domain-containing protein n=1 Tax=Enterococcus faecium TaxID=1352 RepID=UPI000812F491|nr:ABC transporter ATP-binding protein [Enterococcus faecium]